MINIKSDYSEIQELLRKLQNPMRTSLRERLDTILQTQFQYSQAAVHVQTGSLKASGAHDSSATETSWKGKLSYGGVSTGVHNPVKYAVEELERGQSHDYMRDALELNVGYGRAIAAWMVSDG